MTTTIEIPTKNKIDKNLLYTYRQMMKMKKKKNRA